ncbi:MAG TPA: hypothetical protein VK576_08575 [Thermoleophilia bacterium]|nr:hypothetical protein [Thermoleophilia bacterium]
MSVAVLDQSDLGLTWVLDEPLMRASHALVHEDRVWLVDPTDDEAALGRAAELGEPAAVVQLLDRHNRACAAVAARLGVPHLSVAAEVPGSPFGVVRVVDWPVWREVALWWPERRALVVAEALGTAPYYAPGASGAGVSIGLRPWPPKRLGTFVADHLLVGHGAPIHGAGASAAIDEALARSRRDLPHAIAATVNSFRRRP